MINISETGFNNEVIQVTGVVLVDFWAPWCGPCRMVAPVLEEISKDYGNVKIVKVNVDENPGLANEYGIMSIPTVMIFKNGQVVDKFVGALPKTAIVNRLTKWL